MGLEVWVQCPQCGVWMDKFYHKAHLKDSCFPVPSAKEATDA